MLPCPIQGPSRDLPGWNSPAGKPRVYLLFLIFRCIYFSEFFIHYRKDPNYNNFKGVAAKKELESEDWSMILSAYLQPIDFTEGGVYDLCFKEETTLVSEDLSVEFPGSAQVERLKVQYIALLASFR